MGMNRFRTIACAILILTTACSQIPTTRIEFEVHRIGPAVGAEEPPEDEVFFIIHVHQGTSIDPIPQMVVPTGESRQVCKGTFDDGGAFSGWAADCSVEPDRALVAWSRFEDGAEIESGLSMARIPTRE